VTAGRWAWLFDLGSTYTKLSVVDLDGTRLLSAQAPTTVATDVRDGMTSAIAAVEAGGGPRFSDAEVRLASSSAAGGLAMVVSGLVPKLSLEAGRIAALGAGAKLVGAWGYRLTDDDVRAIAAAQPDIILLTGGTDGGDRDAIRHNASALTRLPACPTVVVAGNREVAGEVRDTLAAAAIDVRAVPNIMPELDRLEVEPAREAIRTVFLEEIVRAKGIDRAGELVDRPILPTPSIVLGAVGVLAEDLVRAPTLAIEVGGATTNVHSHSTGSPRERDTIRRGLVEPLLKRTVEGDLGVRYNARTILDLAGAAALGAGAERYIESLGAEPSRLPASAHERDLDAAMATFAARTALVRHAGRLHEVVLPTGPVMVQYGKDLRDVAATVFTGGSVINSPDPAALVRAVLEDHEPLALIPERPRTLLDRRYVLYATGLLAEAGLRAEAARLAALSLEEPDREPARGAGDETTLTEEVRT
jgi:uncharacterized protein (TIGR01319 family)